MALNHFKTAVCAAIISSTTFIMACSAAEAATGTVKVYSGDLGIDVNGTAVEFTDAYPFIDTAGRTMIPLRFVAEQFGYTVEWQSAGTDAPYGAVTIRPGNVSLSYNRQTVYRTLYLYIGSDTITVSDSSSADADTPDDTSTVTMDTTAIIRNDRTYIPLRYVAELLGYNVEWTDGMSEHGINRVYISEYTEIINRYAAAAQNNYYNGNIDFEAMEINEELYLSSNKDLPLTYTLKDMNNDLIPELFIATYISDATGYDAFTDNYNIYDIYTMDGNKAVRMFDVGSMGYRAIYSIRENDLIACDGGGGAFDYSVSFYTLPQGGCVPQSVYCVRYDGYNGGQYFSGTDYDSANIPVPKSVWDSLDSTYPLDTTLEWHDIGDLSWLQLSYAQ